MGDVSIETMADSPSMAILTAAKDSEADADCHRPCLEPWSCCGKRYFHEGEFDVGRGEADIQYVSKDGCRFLGLWPFRPACGRVQEEECGLEAGRTIP